MNSEELEQSLRAEFETHIGNILAQAKQDVSEFQSRIESEFEKHRAQLDEAVRGLARRFDETAELDAGFRESVSEHLKLARDEGARIAATAYSEAEEMTSQSAPPGPGFAELRAAVSEISSQESQSAILKSLVDHSAQFAPRGAFFIIKYEHFAGWRTFGDGGSADGAIREIHFPVAADSILGKAIEGGQMAEGQFGVYAADPAFLVPLHMGQPERMVAIPLIARGRGVAVLYADTGGGSGTFDTDALETLVKIAGLTVELRAGATTAEHEEPAAHEASRADGGSALGESVPQHEGFPPSAADEAVPTTQFDDPGVEEHAFDQEPAFAEEHAFPEAPSPEPPSSTPAESEYHTADGAMVFDGDDSVESAVPATPFERAVQPFEPVGAMGGASIGRVIEPADASSSQPVAHARLSDRPVDLPIDVPEEERRLHNDARRFARLLVSEIKLYNEKKVLEGRQGHDLYDRLKEAIDRSREMYDKRVQPPVAARFDYFHYELVNSLGEGDAARLGSNYPGAMG